MPHIKYIVRFGASLLLRADHSLPESAPCTPQGEVFTFSIADDTYQAFAAAGAATDAPAGHQLVDLRAAYPLLSRTDYLAAGKGFELLHWDAQTCYCGRCATPLVRATEISKRCPACGLELFPQVSPAIIVLVRRGREALFVHARNFRRPIFGLVAGFVETGESLEECVLREVQEETSLRVGNLRYVGSQPWPYPNSLMLGFTADYLSGEVRFADGELTEGGFFTPESLPPLPGPPSIARQMIDKWLADLL